MPARRRKTIPDGYLGAVLERPDDDESGTEQATGTKVAREAAADYAALLTDVPADNPWKPAVPLEEAARKLRDRRRARSRRVARGSAGMVPLTLRLPRKLRARARRVVQRLARSGTPDERWSLARLVREALEREVTRREREEARARAASCGRENTGGLPVPSRRGPARRRLRPKR